MWTRRPRWTGLLLAVLIAALAVPPLQLYFFVPQHVALVEGGDTPFRLRLPFATRLELRGDGILHVDDGALHEGWVLGGRAVHLQALRAGQAEIELHLFGLIPFRRTAVDVLPPLDVIPGGHSIGVLVDDGGVRIAGFSPVGGDEPPARQAGLEVGDLIVRVDGQPVTTAAEVQRLVHQAGLHRRPVQLEVLRGPRSLRVSVQPRRDPASGRFLIGVAVREGTAGVGTLTFYEPRTRIFAALGHVIAGRDGRTPLDVDGGRIVPAGVVDIRPGRRGQPGEKVGRFEADVPPLGTITRNTEYGIAGVLERPLPQPISGPVPVGLLHEVTEGPAELVTVVEGHRLERFQVQIERILGHQRGGKNMVIRVTDPRLLAITGGIVQGMSGSPLLQGGKLVGAVTHVFVNDPTRGYAVSAEWMVLASGVVERLAAVELPPTGTGP